MEQKQIILYNAVIDDVFRYLYDQVKRMSGEVIEYTKPVEYLDGTIRDVTYRQMVQNVQPPQNNRLEVRYSYIIEPEGKPTQGYMDLPPAIIFEGWQLQTDSVLIKVEYQPLYISFVDEFLYDLKKMFEQSAPTEQQEGPGKSTPTVFVVGYPPTIELEANLGVPTYEVIFHGNVSEGMTVIKQAHDRVIAGDYVSRVVILPDEHRHRLHFCEVGVWENGKPDFRGPVEGCYGTIEVVPRPGSAATVRLYAHHFYEVDTREWMLDRWKAIRAELEKDGWTFSSIGEITADEEREVKIPVEPARPEKPEKGANLEKWFDYYHACKQAGLNCTLRMIANETGYAHQTIKTEHAKYIAEHGELSTD